MRLLRIVLIVWLGSVAAADAATLPAASCSSTDVQTAINNALTGDLVVIPGGTCAWTSGVIINGKTIKLQGGGSGRIIAYTADTLTVGTGAVSVNIQAGLNISVGQALRLSQTGTRSNFMDGTVVSYSGTTLAMTVSATGGSGTNHRWLVSTAPTTVLVNNDTVASEALITVVESAQGRTEVSGIKIAAGTGSASDIAMVWASSGNPILVHDCWMESSSNSGDLIFSTTNRGVIWNCSFDSSPFSMAPLALQHKDVPSLTGSWNKPSTMGMADTTGTNNLYVEDSDFHAFLNAFDNDDNGRITVRHALFDNAGMGTHGADTSSIGQRHFEVYDSTFVFNAYTDGTTFNLNWWFYVRGGTFVVADNIMPAIVSQDYGTKPAFNMTVMNLQRNAGPDPCWGAGTSGGADYPAPRQVGMGRITGTRGNDSMAYVGDSEPAYIWGITGPALIGLSDYGPGQPFSCAGSTYDTSANYIVEGRDYFLTQKVGYTKYTYPHPLRAGTTGPGLPTNLRVIR
jgi:hypothetical protein